MEQGTTYLSDTELMSIVIGVGVSEEKAMYMSNDIFKNFDLSTIGSIPIQQLSNSANITTHRASIVSAMFELARRHASTCRTKNLRISSPQAVFAYLFPLVRDKTTEQFDVMLLDTKNRLIKHITTSIGTLNANIVHPREVFKEAILCNADSIIVAHNHPSGDPSPSQSDLDVSRKLIETGKVVGIELYDHVIIGNSSYVSLKEQNLI